MKICISIFSKSKSTIQSLLKIWTLNCTFRWCAKAILRELNESYKITDLIRSLFANPSIVEWSLVHRSGDDDGITLSASLSRSPVLSRSVYSDQQSGKTHVIKPRQKSSASLVLFPSLCSRPAGLRHVHGEARKISSLPGTACLLFLHTVEIDLLQDRWRAATARRVLLAYARARM